MNYISTIIKYNTSKGPKAATSLQLKLADLDKMLQTPGLTRVQRQAIRLKMKRATRQASGLCNQHGAKRPCWRCSETRQAYKAKKKQEAK